MKRSRRDLTPFVIPLIVLVIAVLAIITMSSGSRWDVAERSQINPQANLFGQAVSAAYTDLYAPNKDFFTDDTLMTISTDEDNGVSFELLIELSPPSLGELYVYKTGYYADTADSSWEDFTFEADSSESQDGAWNGSWIRGDAAAEFQIDDGGWKDPGYVIAYVCMEHYKPDLYDILTNQEEDEVNPLFGDYDYTFLCGVKLLSSSALDDKYWHIQTFTVRETCTNTSTNATVCGSRVCGSVLDSCGDSRFCGECSSGTCNSSGQCAGCSDTRSNATVCGSSECDFIKDNCNVDRYCGSCTSGTCNSTGQCEDCTDTSTNSTVCGTKECDFVQDTCGINRYCGSCTDGTCNASNMCEDYACTPATVTSDCDTPIGHDDSCVVKTCDNNECSVVNKTNGEPCTTAIITADKDATCQDGVCTECTDPCKPQDYACGTDVPDTACATCDMNGTNCTTAGETCNTNAWVCEAACTPACSGKVCGPDGCGGTCSPGCTGTDTCTAGQCVPVCTPTTEVCNNLDDDCDGKIDNGINMCASPKFCSAGQCICPTGCAPSSYPQCVWSGGGANFYYSYKDCVLQNSCYVVDELDICAVEEGCTPATGCGTPPPAAEPDYTTSARSDAGVIYVTYCNEGDAYTAPISIPTRLRIGVPGGAWCDYVEASAGLNPSSVNGAGECYEYEFLQGTLDALGNLCSNLDMSDVERMFIFDVNNDHLITESNYNNNDWEGQLCIGTCNAGPDPDTDQAVCQTTPDSYTPGDEGIDFTDGYRGSGIAGAQPECCGDDANEWMLERKIERLGPVPPNSYADTGYYTCCDNSNDCPMWGSACLDYHANPATYPHLYCGDNNVVHVCNANLDCESRGNMRCEYVDGVWQWVTPSGECVPSS